MCSTSLSIKNNVVMEGCIRGEAFVRPKITDVFKTCRVVDWGLLEFLIPRVTNNCILLGESRQEFPRFFCDAQD